jgi:hypothetical protein
MNKQVHNYEGMDYVKRLYLSFALSDTEFAVGMSKDLGRTYSMAQVRSYRLALGIRNNAIKVDDLRAQLGEAKAILGFLVNSTDAGNVPVFEDNIIKARKFLA